MILRVRRFGLITIAMRYHTITRFRTGQHSFDKFSMEHRCQSVWSEKSEISNVTGACVFILHYRSLYYVDFAPPRLLAAVLLITRVDLDNLVFRMPWRTRV